MADFFLAPASNQEAVDFIASKPALTRDAFNKLLPELKARCFTISGIQCADTLQRARDLCAELPAGGDWDAAKKKLVSEISPYFVDDQASAEDQAGQQVAAERRAELLLRTHGQQAYASAQYSMLDEQRKLFPYWQYMSLGDSHVRPTHAALDGVVLPADHEFWKTHFPPWGWGCRCQLVPLTRSDTAQMQKQDAHKPPDQQRVLNDYAQADLTTTRRLVRNGVTYNLTADCEEGKPGAFVFHPSDLRIAPAQLQARYDADIFSRFQAWAQKQSLSQFSNPTTGARATVWDWMNGHAVNEQAGTIAVRPSKSAGTVIAGGHAATASAPQGPAVSAATDLAALKPDVRIQAAELFQLIDRVHGDGVLSAIPFNHLPEQGDLATYFSTPSGAVSIGLDPAIAAQHAKLLLSHEVGHWLDNVGVPHIAPREQFASEEPGGHLQPVIDAIQASAAHARLAALPASKYRNYLLELSELFARAYSQFVATESGDTQFLHGIQQIAADQTPHWADSQWTAADFAPIRAALRATFQKLGWML